MPFKDRKYLDPPVSWRASPTHSCVNYKHFEVKTLWFWFISDSSTPTDFLYSHFSFKVFQGPCLQLQKHHVYLHGGSWWISQSAIICFRTRRDAEEILKIFFFHYFLQLHDECLLSDALSQLHEEYGSFQDTGPGEPSVRESTKLVRYFRLIIQLKQQT